MCTGDGIDESKKTVAREQSHLAKANIGVGSHYNLRIILIYTYEGFEPTIKS